MKPHHLALLAVATVGTFTLAACGDPTVEPGTTPTDPGSTTIDTTPTAPAPTDPAPAQPTDLVAQLDGRTFLSQSATGITLADGAVLRITFEQGRISVSGGCNGMGADATLDGPSLTVGPMMSTMMACEQPLMDQDAAVSAFFADGTTLALDGDTLTITGTSNGAPATITLLDRVVADPDRPLEGTVWTVNGVISDDAISSGWGGTVATITITDGAAQVNTGCNTGQASATIEGDTITFGPLALTKKMCDDDAMRLEREVTTVLQGTVTFDIEAASLTLRNGTAGLMLVTDV